MSWLIWGVVGVLAGLVCYLAVPILIGPQLGWGKQQWFLSTFVSQAQTALDRGGLVSVSSSGLELTHFARDSQEWTCEIDGTTYRFSDPGARMGRLHDRPFGLAHGNVDRLVSAEDLAVAEADIRAQETKGNNRNIQLEEQTVNAVRNTAPLPSTPQVTFHYLPEFVDNSGSPQDPELVDSYVEHAFSKFGGRDLVDVMALVMAAGAGVGIAWFLGDYAPSGGGSSVSIPIHMAGSLVGVVPI